MKLDSPKNVMSKNRKSHCIHCGGVNVRTPSGFITKPDVPVDNFTWVKRSGQFNVGKIIRAV